LNQNRLSANSHAAEAIANLGYADGALAQQVSGDRTLRGTFRQMERIARGHAMVVTMRDSQQPLRVARIS